MPRDFKQLRFGGNRLIQSDQIRIAGYLIPGRFKAGYENDRHKLDKLTNVADHRRHLFELVDGIWRHYDKVGFQNVLLGTLSTKI